MRTFLILLLCQPLFCEASECVLWEQTLRHLPSKDSIFLLAGSDKSDAGIIFLKKEREVVFVRQDGDLLRLNYKEALNGMHFYALGFLFPIEQKDCLKIGSIITKTVNDLKFTIKRPYARYLTSTISKNGEVITDVVFECDCDLSKTVQIKRDPRKQKIVSKLRSYGR